MKSLICRAIAERRVVSMTYAGGRRVVEPYCHGIRRGRVESVRAYQRSGHSGSGEEEGWKFFATERITELVLLDATFDLRHEAEYATNELVIIHCDVAGKAPRRT